MLKFNNHTCESLLPRRTTEAASDAAFSFASIFKAIPTSASAKEGASFMPSPTYKVRIKYVSMTVTMYSSLTMPNNCKASHLQLPAEEIT